MTPLPAILLLLASGDPCDFDCDELHSSRLAYCKTLHPENTPPDQNLWVEHEQCMAAVLEDWFYCSERTASCEFHRCFFGPYPFKVEICRSDGWCRPVDVRACELQDFDDDGDVDFRDWAWFQNYFFKLTREK